MPTTTDTATATPEPGPRTIRRNARHQIAAIRQAVTRCMLHSLDNDFVAVPVDTDRAFTEWFDNAHARLTEDVPGRKWTVHIHSNRWFYLYAPAEQDAAEADDAKAFEIGDVVRTAGGSSERVVTGISPRTPVDQYDAAMARFEAGRGVKPRTHALISTRALRDGCPFGPALDTRPTRLTLIRRAAADPVPVDDPVVVVAPSHVDGEHNRMECTGCGLWPAATYVDDDGTRRYTSHRSPTEHPAWCDTSDEPVPVHVIDSPAPARVAEEPTRTPAERTSALLAAVLEEDPDFLSKADRVEYAVEAMGYLRYPARAALVDHVEPNGERLHVTTAAPTDVVAELVGHGLVDDEHRLTGRGVLVHQALTGGADALYAWAQVPAHGDVVDGRAPDVPVNKPHPVARARFIAPEWSQAAERVGGDDYTHAAADLSPYLDRDPAAAADLARYFQPGPEPVSPNDNTADTAAADRTDETGDDDQ